MKGNNKDLYMRLDFTSGDENFEYCKLAKHQFQKLKDMHHTKGGELNAFKLPSKMTNIESMEFISKWYFGEV